MRPKTTALVRFFSVACLNLYSYACILARPGRQGVCCRYAYYFSFLRILQIRHGTLRHQLRYPREPPTSHRDQHGLCRCRIRHSSRSWMKRATPLPSPRPAPTPQALQLHH